MTLKNILLGILPAIVALSGCDKITNPIKVIETNSSLPNTPPTYRDSSTTYSTYKLLLEDCMGHYCGNCPPAAEEADSLSQFNSHVITIEDHLGFFADTAGESGGPAQPSGLPSNAFKEDLRCQATTDWENFFNYQSFPQGMIDRVHYSSTTPSSTGVSPGNWITIVDSLITANPHASATINIHDSCWVPQRVIGAQLTINFPFSLSGNYMLEALIVEDSCFGWQVDDYSTPEDDSIFNHRYVVRGAFYMNSWGALIPASVTSGAGTYTQYYTYNFITGENGKAIKWNMAHCYIVAYVYNQVTYQIIQAEEIKVE